MRSPLSTPSAPCSRLFGWLCLVLAAMALLHGHAFEHAGADALAGCESDDDAAAHWDVDDGECSLCLLVPDGPASAPRVGVAMAVGERAHLSPLGRPRASEPGADAPPRAPPVVA